MVFWTSQIFSFHKLKEEQKAKEQNETSMFLQMLFFTSRKQRARWIKLSCESMRLTPKMFSHQPDVEISNFTVAKNDSRGRARETNVSVSLSCACPTFPVSLSKSTYSLEGTCLWSPCRLAGKNWRERLVPVATKAWKNKGGEGERKVKSNSNVTLLRDVWLHKSEIF